MLAGELCHFREYEIELEGRTLDTIVYLWPRVNCERPRVSATEEVPFVEDPNVGISRRCANANLWLGHNGIEA